MPITCVPYTQFSPTSITGCQLWLDGADPAGTGVKPSNGASVTTWVDKSGSGNSVTCPSSTYSSNSTTGQSGIYFNSSATSALTLSPYCSFFVSSYGTGPNFPSSYPGLLGSYYVVCFGTYWMAANAYGAGGVWAPNRSINTYGAFLSDSRNITLNSVAADPPAAISVRVGAGDSYPGGNQWIGHIYDVIVYNTTLTNSQRQQVEGYLAQKWGLTSQLPAGHPGLTNTYYGSGSSTRPRTFLTKQVYPTGTFSPLSLSGCRLWLDASDTSSLTITGGSNVTQWRDKSGSNNHATGVNNPVYANGTINFLHSAGRRFDLPNNALPSGSASYSYYIICSFTDSTLTYSSPSSLIAGGSFTGGDDNNSFSFTGFLDAGNPYVGIVWGNFGYSYASSFSYNSNTLITNTFTSPSNVGLYANGTPAPGNGNFSFIPRNQGNGNNNIGGGYAASTSHSGTISEIIVYSNALTTTQQQQVEGYLAQKWGMSASLAAGHPGRTQLFYGTQTPTGRVTNFFINIPKTVDVSAVSTALSYLPLLTNSTDIGTSPKTITVNGTVTYTTVAGKQTAYFTNNPNNYLSFPYVNQTAFTLCYWVCPAESGYYTSVSITTSSLDPALQSDLTGSTTSITIYTAMPNQWANQPSGTINAIGAWTHIAITINQTTYVEQLYINGSLASTATGSGSGISSRNLFFIGRSGDTGPRAATGYVRQFCFFPTVLTQAQIQAVQSYTA